MEGRISNKWLAGLMDGDCTMMSFLSGRSALPRVSFSQLDLSVVLAVHQRYGGHLTTKGAKNMTYVEWSGRTIVNILEPIVPYLVVKRRRALWLLEMTNHIGHPLTQDKVNARLRLHKLVRGDDGTLGKYLTISRQWLAGFLEADGSISAFGAHARPVVNISQKDPRILLEIKRRYGGAVRYSKRLDCNDLVWFGTAAAELLKKLAPYLKIKHEQAKLAIQLGDLLGTPGVALTRENISQRTELRKDIRRLNARR